jgi:1A family penicillin-binding protein
VIKILWGPRVLGLGTLLFFGLGVGAAWGTWRNVCSDCPSIAQIRTFEPQQASKLYSHDGRLLAELGIERRTPVSINSLPEYVPQAFVAVEDKRFYDHRGIDPRGMARAIVGVLTGQNRGGGSTITQQLARNMFETRVGFERRVIWRLIVRKLKEFQVAFSLERAYTKDQILEAYMNEINYGHGWWGIQTASRNYFAKNAADLNPAEAALLAAIPNLPEYYSPLRNPENAERRRRLVLRRMVDQGILPPVDFERYANAPLPTERAIAGGSVAPYFVEWVRQILDDRFGSKLYTAGLNVYTTLDIPMQRAAETSMQEGWAGIEARAGFSHISYAAYRDSLAAGVVLPDSVAYVEGLFVALDPWTGSVRAMIGGRDFGLSKFNRATQALRQAGSGFKPFVYTAAVASRIPTTYIVLDSPWMSMQPDGTEWRPSNYDGRFEGPMTIRTGLMRSQNIIAIKLANEIGLESVAQTARSMGIRSEIERFPSTAIGAVEVRPIEMAEAYSTFANQGTKVRPFPILRVEDVQGRTLWNPQPERTEVLDPLVARVMISMLQGVIDGGTGYNAIRLAAGLPREVVAGGKTGTTNDGADIWFNGFTPNLLATVWFGMDRPQQIWPNATGAGAPAPVWGNFMRRVYYGDPNALDDELKEPTLPVPEPWEIPDGLVTRLVDRTTGKLASQWCPQEEQILEMFLPGTEPTEFCDRDDFVLFRALPN